MELSTLIYKAAGELDLDSPEDSAVRVLVKIGAIHYDVWGVSLDADGDLILDAEPI